MYGNIGNVAKDSKNDIAEWLLALVLQFYILQSYIFLFYNFLFLIRCN